MNLNVPLNSLSFGNVSFNILAELYDRGIEPCIFPIGNVDISAFDLSEIEGDFQTWLNQGFERGVLDLDRERRGLKLWHIQGLGESFQNTPCAITFHETDRITPVEKNILSQQKVVFVTSNYTKKVFEESGLKNVIYCPLGFDSRHFKKTNKRYLGKNVKTFGLFGKLESRKNTLRVLASWIRKFGNQDGYFLNCAISSAFIDEQKFKALIRSTFPNGEQPFNVNFLPFQPTLKEYNDVLNSIDVDLTGMSSCEGFNLPAFQSLCLGKWAVCLDAHVHRDFANESNAILVPQNGERDADDGIFFRNGYFVNQGKWADYSDEDLDKALDKASKLAKTPNPEGEKLAEKFTWKNTVDIILENI